MLPFRSTLPSLLELLTTKEYVQIIAATGTRPRTVRELREQFGLPIVSTYRYVNALVDAGLLNFETKHEPSGRPVRVYSNTIERFHIYYENNKLSGELVVRGKPAISLDELLLKTTLREEETAPQSPASAGQPGTQYF